MNASFFLDTNIFVYSFDRDSPAKARRATQLITEGVTTGKGKISYQVVQEFFNVAFRRFATPMSPAEAEEYLAAALQPMLAVHSSRALFAEAIRVRHRHRLAWYDALIVASALQAGCGVLYSEDLHHGHRFGDLQVENPFA